MFSGISLARIDSRGKKGQLVKTRRLKLSLEAIFLSLNIRRRMANTDIIANMLTVIRNAVAVKKEFAIVPVSKINTTILEILKTTGYIENYRLQEGSDVKNKIKVYLKYGVNKKPVIRGLKRISRSGLRAYRGYKEIAPVLRGFGLAIVSTSQGLMTDIDAREKKLGGEILCHVW